MSFLSSVADLFRARTHQLGALWEAQVCAFLFFFSSRIPPGYHVLSVGKHGFLKFLIALNLKTDYSLIISTSVQVV